MVLKSEFENGADTFSLYVNPTPGGPEPVVADAVSFASVSNVLGLTLYSTGAFSSDEFRIGETFADVVPVPEPEYGLATLIVTLVLLRFRVRAS
ncbi:MAG: hypothetical protein AAF497_14065 [Planctomycetota bacterium]